MRMVADKRRGGDVLGGGRMDGKKNGRKRDGPAGTVGRIPPSPPAHPHRPIRDKTLNLLFNPKMIGNLVTASPSVKENTCNSIPVFIQ